MATFHPGKVTHELPLMTGENPLRVVMTKNKKPGVVGGVVHHRLADVGMLLQAAAKVAAEAGELCLTIAGVGTIIRATVSTKMDPPVAGTGKAMKSPTAEGEVFQGVVQHFRGPVQDKTRISLNGPTRTSLTLLT